MSILFKHPIWAMAFRPFYSLAALYGALSILLWGFGYQGTPELSGFYWHAHEMIWGYAGLVVIAFLLTAVATWTGQPPTRGGALAGLTAFWLAARIAAFIPGWGAVASGIAGTVFFWYGAVCMAIPVYRSRNKRNYIAVFAIFVLGGTHVAFHRHLNPLDGIALLNGLVAGLIMVAAFIGLIGTRIISFLLPLAALFTFAAGIINLIQVCRWWNNAILKEPMLWILFAGYFFTALGLTAIGLSHFKLQLLNLGVHLIGVGGIGVLTLGMMARTALGHTGHPIYPAPKPIPLAFWLMIAATLIRIIATFVSGTAYTHSIRCSAALFAASLLLYAWRYIPWLIKPRADGKAG